MSCCFRAQAQRGKLEAVGFFEGAIEERLGDFEADEVVVGVRGVAAFGDFENVEAEFGFDVGERVVLVGDSGTEFLL